MQTAAAMGNWWLAASSRQCTCSCTMSSAVLAKHLITQVAQPPYSPDLVPKTKITFEREENSDCWWDSWKYSGAAEGNSNQGFCRVFWTVEEMLGELCEVPKCLPEGNWGVIVLCTMYLLSSAINVSIFHSTWLETFWTDLTYAVEYYSAIKGKSWHFQQDV